MAEEGEHHDDLDEDGNFQAWNVKAVKLEPKVEIFVEEHCFIQHQEGLVVCLDKSKSTPLCDEVASQVPDLSSNDASATVTCTVVEVSSGRGCKRKMPTNCSPLESNLGKKTSPKVDRLAVNTMRKSNSDRKFDCEMCGKSFSLRSQITKHLREHSDEPPFTCKFCHEHFSGSGPLERHERLNTGDIPYRCKLCSKEFMYGCSLLLHLRTHTVDKPYICKLCNKSLTDSRSLLKHLRLHAGVTGYRCEVCGKHFTRKSELSRHFRVHTGEKPYRCKTCNKCFSQSNDLLRHTGIQLV